MKFKIFITQISNEAAATAEKTSKISGVHFAKYCLTAIDDSETKMQTQVYTGDVISCLRKVLVNTKIPSITLGNFRIVLKYQNNTETEKLDTVTLEQLSNCIDATIYGDGVNSLARLNTSHAIAVANVCGRRGETTTDYGCVLCFPSGQYKMVSWKTVEKNLRTGQFFVHNVLLQHDKLIRTNISSLDTVYLTIEATQKKAEQTSAPKQANPTDEAKKHKLVADLVKAKSPLAYVISDDYELESLQYILKTRTQGEDVSYMLNPAYTVEQLRELHAAVLKDIDISLIADPSISAKTMANVVKKIEYDLWDCIDVQNLRRNETKGE